jgi:hypothetical protein
LSSWSSGHFEILELASRIRSIADIPGHAQSMKVDIGPRRQAIALG